MTETIKYQSPSRPPHEEIRALFVRRLVRERRYDRLLSQVALLGKVLSNVLSNVQSNLSSGATAQVLRRSR
ncbi:hypothetical protein [Paludibacterium purpuratum]|uniref:Uncharacterized protein n=1 Tax=Paludibacterium purpuratum TaxID=1144873 RepID=A0A4V3DVA3_9NEIS|nr:hypothetical protein [Paludibacterium purpuratum]TDR79789.1 hypothetical protein DFP86_107155 [Paludibacterium purpuratum]